jgi:hypothetical protein
MFSFATQAFRTTASRAIGVGIIGAYCVTHPRQVVRDFTESRAGAQAIKFTKTAVEASKHVGQLFVEDPVGFTLILTLGIAFTFSLAVIEAVTNNTSEE